MKRASPLPAGVNPWCIDTQPDPVPDLIRAAAALEGAFGVPFSPADRARRLQAWRDLMEFWGAEAAGEIICAGRLELITGTAFAGIWGSGTVPEWRHLPRARRAAGPVCPEGLAQ